MSEELEAALAAISTQAARASAAEAECDRLREKIAGLEGLADEVNELRRLFEMQHRRTDEAVKLWRDAHPDRDVFPDLGELLSWLLAERDRLRKRDDEFSDEIIRLDLECGHLQAERDADREGWHARLTSSHAREEKLRAVLAETAENVGAVVLAWRMAPTDGTLGGPEARAVLAALRARAGMEPP